MGAIAGAVSRGLPRVGLAAAAAIARTATPKPGDQRSLPRPTRHLGSHTRSLHDNGQTAPSQTAAVAGMARNRVPAAAARAGVGSAGTAVGCCTEADHRFASSGASEHAVLSREVRVARRVAERNSWATWHRHKIREAMFLLSDHVVDLFGYRDRPTKAFLDAHFPVVPVDYDKLRNPPHAAGPVQCTWIGHSTVLVQLDGLNVICDPIFSERCSAYQFVGPIRFRPPACTVDDLKREGIDIDLVLISHNHYDHLDYHSVRDIAREFDPEWIVPLMLRDWFETHCPDALTGRGLTELDWHDTRTLGGDSGHTVTATPAQHWSVRRPWDRDESLWCSFAVEGKNGAKFFYAGDTAWFEGLHDIGTQYGPFDLAAIPIGAYAPRDFLMYQHVNPEEAVAMVPALRATRALPIHWGTFKLAQEGDLEPRELLESAVAEAGMDEEVFKPWLIGQTL